MKKKGKIAIRTLLFILLVTVFLLVSISVSVAMLVRNVFLKNYSDFALSYVKSASQFIDGDKIKKYYSTGDKDAYYNEIEKYINATANSTYSADEKEPNGASIKYFYVFVPDDEEYIYIWDAEPGLEPAELLESYPYSEGAKEQALKIVNKEVEEDVQTYTDAEDGTETLTVSVGLKDSSDNVVAIIAADLSVSGINSALRDIIVNIVIAILDIMIITMVVYYFVVRKRIIDPIVKLQSATQGLVEGIENDKQLSIDIKTNDEIEMLSDSIVEMDEKLRDYIKQNEAITAEKERIGTELALATRIQADMLPNVFPPFPERSDFDIYASMTPAKEVGGDFYDFFFVDNNHLAVVMADVSGKGVPAALFMMMSKILIQNATMSGKTPAKVLETVNNQICSNNREEMFVTVWLGIIDLESGVLTAANAGHEKPIIKDENGEFEIFMDKNGFVIGGMPGVKYRDYEIQLKKGSKLFIYTDGVAEAMNKSDELFGIDRTVSALNEANDKDPKAILENIKKRVDLFVGDAPQFDDLTMLCFEYIGTGETGVTFEAKLDNVPIAMEYVAKKAESLAFSEKDKYQLDIAVDEIVSNVARYAYEEKEGKVTVKAEVDRSGIEITVIDSGIPYNPLEKEDPDITLPAEERGVGGYGIFIVKKVMDDITYEYKDGQNILKMKKALNKKTKD